MFVVSLVLLATLLASAPQDAVHQRPTAQPAAPAADSAKKGPEKDLSSVEKPVITHHEVTIAGKRLRYTATAGMMPIGSPTGETEANLFFVAYTSDPGDKPGERPLLFAFNGGPGSSSVWLHLGAIGPRRVELPDDGGMPAPPFRLIDNPETWLANADLVFIDPVGTGYSRAVTPDQAAKFFSLKGDLDSVGEFIRLYLTRYERWSSPLFLVGESYGSTRAAGLAGNLFEHGISFNGIILVSTILNFSTIGFTPGNDLPYALFLPSYAATAWFHKKLPGRENGDLAPLMAEAERWAMGDYLAALAKGDRLTPVERQEVVRRLALFTGLDQRYIENSNLRIEAQRFTKELLRDTKKVTGRFDGRLLGNGLFGAGEDPEFDPSLTAIRPAFTAAMNDYARAELGYRSDREYHILGGGIGRWDWGANNSFLDTSEHLRNALAKNPFMKVFVASGYFDLATPYLGTDYTVSHLELSPSQRHNVVTTRYEAGHMMYTDRRSRLKLEEDVAAFIRSSLRSR